MVLCQPNLTCSCHSGVKETALLQLCVVELVPLLQFSGTHPAVPPANGRNSSGLQCWDPYCNLSPQSSTCGLRNGTTWGWVSRVSAHDVWKDKDEICGVFSCVVKFLTEREPKVKVRFFQCMPVWPIWDINLLCPSDSEVLSSSSTSSLSEVKSSSATHWPSRDGPRICSSFTSCTELSSDDKSLSTPNFKISLSCRAGNMRGDGWRWSQRVGGVLY